MGHLHILFLRTTMIPSNSRHTYIVEIEPRRKDAVLTLFESSVCVYDEGRSTGRFRHLSRSAVFGR